MIMGSSGDPGLASAPGATCRSTMSTRKHVARPDCGRVPKSLLVALLNSVIEIGATPDQVLRQVGSGVCFRDLVSGDDSLVELELFTSVNRACNAHLRAYIEGTERGSCLGDYQLILLCKCLVGCSDLREAIVTTTQFFEMLAGRIGRVVLRANDETARLYIATVVSRRSQAALAVDLYNIALIHKLYEWLIDDPIPLETVEFRHDSASRSDLHLSLFSCPSRFGTSDNCLTFSVEYLSRPVIRRRSELNSLLDGFPFNLIVGGQQRTSLAEHTYRAMVDAHTRLKRVPCVDQVARLFGITSWTLRRRLADENTSYSTIRRRVQLSIATEFLRRGDLTINEVADMANFSDAGAFRRAFQQWTGCSPSAYREDVLHA